MQEHSIQYYFPDPNEADEEGLIAVGGCLDIDCLLTAYRNGIFPWFNENDPYLWWSPDPRAVLFPSKVHISASMKKLLKKKLFDVTYNQCFDEVIEACSMPRKNNHPPLELDVAFDGLNMSEEHKNTLLISDTFANRTNNAGQPLPQTWITGEMKQAYKNLHKNGYAMSVEVWDKNTLVGGLYGVYIGKIFFGESMFSFKSNASKFGLIHLCQTFRDDIFLIDCQMKTDHLMRMGAELIDRSLFLNYVRKYT